MNRFIAKAGVALLLAAGTAQAAGPLYLLDSSPPRPYAWDTSKGAIPVWTDGGEAFTFDFDGVTPFITIERANQITQFAFDQWNNVKTATFEAKIAGTIESKIGIADVTGANAAQLYEKQNGYGFWVLYDTDGAILEEYFGVPRDAVLGIAFPEWADDDGRITEATALLNGWFVDASDVNGELVAGVFTHEFGHAVNLSHAQVNGPMVYSSYTFRPFYPGVPQVRRAGALLEPLGRRGREPRGSSDRRDDVSVHRHAVRGRPRAEHRDASGRHRGHLEPVSDRELPCDDRLDLRRAAAQGRQHAVQRHQHHRAQRGQSARRCGLGDVGRPDAGPDRTGRPVHDQQPHAGPGLRGLHRGDRRRRLPDPADAAGLAGRVLGRGREQQPGTDRPCNKSTIRAEAGVTKTANITFNGYARGVEFTPIVSAYLTDLAKNGRSAAGQAETTVFTWNKTQGFEVLPPELIATNSSMTRNGQWVLVAHDANGNGIAQATLRSQNGALLSLGDLNGDTCGGGSQSGFTSSYGWAVDDAGRTAVGTAYIDRDKDGSCESPNASEIVPFIWTAQKGMRELNTSNLPMDELPWVRAHAVSGNGEVVLGTSNFQYAFAWVKEGKAINLTERFGADANAYAVSFDGHRVALNITDPETFTSKGVALWDYARGLTPIGSLKWCIDVPYVSLFGGDLCQEMSPAEVEAAVGKPPVEIYDMSDDGSILIGRTGSFFTGFIGALWIEQVGWMTWDSFFRKQGVVEASRVQFSNPISISGTGREVVGGTVGAAFSWLANIDQVFVCERGNSVQTGYPNGLRAKIAAGAKFGRCEHLND